MTHEKYVVQLRYVPISIYSATDGDIQADMYLMGDAVECLLNGEMISGLDCRWYQATLLNKEVAEKAKQQLSMFGMIGDLIQVF